MRKLKLFLSLLMLFSICMGNVWADEETYTFNDKTWTATDSSDEDANWSSGKDGNGFTSGQGVQVTKGASGANATSPESFENISEIVVTYCTNASNGVGTIHVQVGDNDEKTFSVTKPSSGGTTLKTATFTYSTAETGNVYLEVTCSTNSVYIHSVQITYTPSNPGSSNPTL